MARVTGIGGVFFKANDPDKLGTWYRDCLGIQLESWGGAALRWPEDTAEDKGVTVFTLAKADTAWFEPSQSPFMINYRVDDLDGILVQLANVDCVPVKGPEQHENGRFAWVMDPEGNKVELWEPKLWDDKNKG